MRITPSHFFGGYAAVMTIAAAWFGLSGMALSPRPATRFDTIDVQRINVREPDGTLRMTISNHATIPGYIAGAKEYPHPNRPEAGMLFYNDEGIENGGLVFDGGMKDGKPTNGGSLTFDRYRQDQTLQLISTEDGAQRTVGVVVNDRPDVPLDFGALVKLSGAEHSPGFREAWIKGGGGNARRAWLGRTPDGTVSLALNDPEGHPRLVLAVDKNGEPKVEVLNAAGKVTRTL